MTIIMERKSLMDMTVERQREKNMAVENPNGNMAVLNIKVNTATGNMEQNKENMEVRNKFDN